MSVTSEIYRRFATSLRHRGKATSEPNPRVQGPALAFAAGGLVPDAAPQAAASNAVRIVNVIDPEMAADYLNSSAGEKTILNILQRNAGAVRQVLS